MCTYIMERCGYLRDVVPTTNEKEGEQVEITPPMLKLAHDTLRMKFVRSAWIEMCQEKLQQHNNVRKSTITSEEDARIENLEAKTSILARFELCIEPRIRKARIDSEKADSWEMIFKDDAIAVDHLTEVSSVVVHSTLSAADALSHAIASENRHAGTNIGRSFPARRPSYYFIGVPLGILRAEM